jgi:hypothetical protein
MFQVWLRRSSLRSDSGFRFSTLLELLLVSRVLLFSVVYELSIAAQQLIHSAIRNYTKTIKSAKESETLQEDCRRNIEGISNESRMKAERWTFFALV